MTNEEIEAAQVIAELVDDIQCPCATCKKAAAALRELLAENKRLKEQIEQHECTIKLEW